MKIKNNDDEDKGGGEGEEYNIVYEINDITKKYNIGSVNVS